MPALPTTAPARGTTALIRPRRRRFAGRAAPLALAALMAGCSPRPEPAVFALPAATAARIRLICPPGTFIGTMTANCPQPLARAAPPQ